MPTFWDERFEAEGEVWGSEPSPSAMAAARLFEVWEVRHVLVAGCAYGRHVHYFAKEGFDVVGLDTSALALEMARAEATEQGLDCEFVQADATRIPVPDERIDAIYDRALLHLLLADEREAAVAEYHRVLRTDGVLFATYFSDEDAEYGQGEEIEAGTFDAKGGRPAHFFSEGELRDAFVGFHVSVLRLIDEYEEHGDTPHLHRFWEIIAEKE